MCGPSNLRTPMTILAKQLQFDLDAVFADIRPRYNIAPTQQVLAVRVPETGAKRQLVALKWGLVPSWAKDTKIAYSTINARADSVATKPAAESPKGKFSEPGRYDPCPGNSGRKYKFCCGRAARAY